MTATVVTMPAPVTLIPAKNLEERLAEQAGRPGVPQDPRRIIADLNARAGGVPATVTASAKVGPGLRLYGPGYVIWLLPTSHQGAYRITGVFPMGMQNHADLLGGYLQLKPSAWQWADNPSKVATGADAGWPRIQQAWQSRAVGNGGRKPSAEALRRVEFLDTLDDLIDTTEGMAIDRQKGASGFPFHGVAATSGRRDGVSSVYEFRLVGEETPEVKTVVQIVNGANRLRGQVTRVDGGTATVRFDGPVDWPTLNQQGILQPLPNTTVYKRQREAVERLRDDRAVGGGLPAAFVEHRTAPFTPSAYQPHEPLDPEQLSAFQRALTVPDLLAVLGPPGTGKTRTIVEITRACALATPPQRVLVTSHTHRAVDNILGRLPSDLVVIRVARNEENVTKDGQPYLLSRQAADLRQEILGATALKIDDHQGVSSAEQSEAELYRRAEALSAAVRQVAACEGELRITVRALREVGQKRHGKVVTRLAQIKQEAALHDSAATRLSESADRAWFTFRANRKRARAEDLTALIGTLEIEHTQLTRELKSLEAEMADGWRNDPSVVAAETALRRAREQCRGPVDDALEAAEFVHTAVAYAAFDLDCPGIPAQTAGDAADVDRRVTAFCTWLRSALPILRARADLLGSWHDTALKESDQLNPELIRYADVIAATCSGTATVDDLGEIELDLAIVDEAGQIGLPDALVPLVRAKRAVLVGDDRQLPPFLDDDVKQWGSEKADPRTLELLTKSALELLIARIPQTNIVQLTRQRRMPADVCAFISDRFYRGVLTTEGEPAPYQDPLFTRPMAFVDMSFLPEDARRERSGGRRENWNMSGTSNSAEADVLAELAVLYHARGADWAVIVPYRAQVALVTEKIAARIRNIDVVRHGVGTVDSFQGGERDVILYGFTRSNSRGDVGFLKELRRINVALSRVRRQLVMVGDPTTLGQARDPGFKELAHALRRHLDTHGEIVNCRDVFARAKQLNDIGG